MMNTRRKFLSAAVAATAVCSVALTSSVPPQAQIRREPNIGGVDDLAMVRGLAAATVRTVSVGVRTLPINIEERT